MNIRLEKPTDYREVENLTREAYKDVLLGFYPILKRWRMTKH